MSVAYVSCGRIFNTYGPRMHPSDGRVVSNFIMQALTGEPITIYGEGEQTRSFCYCLDLIEAFVRIMGTDDSFTGPVNNINYFLKNQIYLTFCFRYNDNIAFKLLYLR